MPYIAKQPGTAFRTFTDKDTFTGDGSTVVFDMQFAIAEAGQNDLQVFVGSTRQIPGTDYTLGVGGSSEYKRINFTSATADSSTITVLNPGTQQGEFSSVGDNAVTSGKLNVDAITGQTELAEQAADGDEYLIHDTSAGTLKRIAASNVTPNETLITGKSEISIGNVSGDDVLLIYDTSAGVLKKITKSAFDALQPGFTSVSPSNLLTGDGTGNYTIVVTGTDFDTTCTFKLVTNGGTDIAMDSVTRNSAVQLTGVVAKNKTNLTDANEPFDIVITNGNGLSITSANAVNIDAQPAWVTASGSLGTIVNYARSSYSQTVEATDPESGAITYALVTGTLPGGLSLNTTTGVISGNVTAVASNTTYNFTIEARDAASNATERDFSFVVQAPQVTSFTSSGTFSVPSGLTSVNVLVIAGGGAGGKSGPNGGGGGGAGGLIYRPGFPVTPGGSVSVTVGDGGPAPSGDSTPNPSHSGQDSAFGTLTAKGGGVGGVHNKSGVPGGSGGGAGRDGESPNNYGSATQPNQSGESGNYGFGFNGGSSGQGGSQAGGGGGGAGGTGKNGFANDYESQPGTASAGGDGKQYDISGSTVGYAGGGTASAQVTISNQPLAYGGGSFGPANAQGWGPGSSGTANRGGGGGAGRGPGYSAGSGGKGIVIVSY